MLTLTNPKWINSFYYPYQSFEEIPQSLFDAINRDLIERTSAEPLVSIIIPARNEEINILRSVASLSRLDTQIPFEIIVVNNNSSYNTQLTVDKLHVCGLYEQQHGCGPAR